MRITNAILVNHMLSNLFTNQEKMDKLQNQIATGKKISVPSDDPIIAARSLKLRTDLAEGEQFNRNTSDASSWLQTTDTILGNLEDVIQRARELAIQGANSVLSVDDMQKIAKEVEQLKSQAIQIGNSTYAGRYVFSGYKTDRKLINDDPKSDEYGNFLISVNTSSEKLKFEIGIGDHINVNVPGGDLFNAGSTTEARNGITTANSAVAFPIDIKNGENDGLNMLIDGETVSIKLTEGKYNNEAEISTEIENKINTATVKAEGIQVDIVDNKLGFTSGSTGPSSSILVTNGSALNILGLNSTSVTLGTEDRNAIGNVRGTVTGSENIKSLSIDDTNNELNVTVDGASISIKLDNQNYPSIDALAEEIQRKINQKSEVVFPVTVQSFGNKLSFTSGKTGSSSSVLIDGGSCADSLGLTLTSSLVGTSSQKGRLIDDMEKLYGYLSSGDFKNVGLMIKKLDFNTSNILRIRADVGARINRIELTINRLDADKLAFTKLQSANEDVDMAEAIMNLQNEENVYRASLAGGAKIIQPSLVDFLR